MLRVKGAVFGVDERPWTMFEGTPQEKSGVSYTALIGSGVDVDEVKVSEEQAVILASHQETGVAVELKVIPQLAESKFNLLAPFKLRLRCAEIVEPVAAAAAPLSAVAEY